jgi:uncharacterized protein with GYD domain
MPARASRPRLYQEARNGEVEPIRTWIYGLLATAEETRAEKEGSMPVYLTLFQWTDSGVKNIKDAPARMAEGRETVEKFGGKVLGLYAMMGKYDLFSVTEWPNDESATTSALAISSRGNVRTTTLRAYTEAEFAEIAKKMP